MVGQFEADADVDTDVSKAKPARKKSVSKATGSEEKAKTPRKRAPKKQANASAEIDGDQMDSTEEKGDEITKPTPKKRGPKAKKNDVNSENGMKGENDADGVLEPATPKAAPVKKRTPKSKKESGGGETGLSASNSSKKRASMGEIAQKDDVTPSKKPRGASSKLPTNRSELKDEDKLMLQMKKDGKPWNEIIAAYSAMTGLEYGKTTLPNRYYKIMDALIEWKDGDVSLLPALLE